MRWLGWLWCAAVMMMSAGCVPERMTWSPDGTRGAVMGGDDSLHFCDTSGKLSKVTINGVHGMGWLPDGKGLVVVHEVEAKKTWKEIEAIVPREAAEAKKNAAAVLKLLRDQASAYPSVEKFQEGTMLRLELRSDEFALVVMYLREHEEEAVKSKVSDTVWKYITEAAPVLCVAQVFTVTETEAKAKAGANAAYFVNENAVFDVRVSSTGQAVAITKGRHRQSHYAGDTDVTVAALDGAAAPIRLEETCFPD